MKGSGSKPSKWKFNQEFKVPKGTPDTRTIRTWDFQLKDLRFESWEWEDGVYGMGETYLSKAQRTSICTKSQNSIGVKDTWWPYQEFKQPVETQRGMKADNCFRKHLNFCGPF